MKRSLQLALLLAAAALAACDVSLAADVTPPPDAIISGGEVPPIMLEYPPAAADLAVGAQIYVQSCAPCHGESGRGDGSQANLLAVQPSPIGVAERADAATPADWYLMITQGNLDNFMPPFVNQLTLQQRWDVLAYVYSLSQDELAAQAGPLFAEHEAALRAALPLADIRQMAAYSRHDIVAAVEQALPSLSSAELVALGAYVQMLSLGVAPETPASGESEASALASMHGRVQDGTDGELAADLQATLFGYEGQTLVHSQTAPVDADGSFVFDEVPQEQGRTFFASVDYLGLSYFSEFLTDGQTEFSQPITIFETTHDTDQLAVERLTLILEFDNPGQVRVVQQYLISNIGNQAVTPQDDGTPVLLFDLPQEASELAFNEGLFGERYIPTETGFGDLRAVLPGLQSYQLLLAYQMPYARSLNLPLSLHMPVRSVAVLVQDSDVRLQNSNFTLAGEQEIEGRTYTAYISNQAFSANEQIELELRGRNPQGSGGWQRMLASDGIVVGLAALTVAVGLAWLWLRRLQAGPQELLARIVRLDERFANGNIAENHYKRQRAALKEQLARATKDK